MLWGWSWKVKILEENVSILSQKKSQFFTHLLLLHGKGFLVKKLIFSIYMCKLNSRLRFNSVVPKVKRYLVMLVFLWCFRNTDEDCGETAPPLSCVVKHGTAARCLNCSRLWWSGQTSKKSRQILYKHFIHNTRQQKYVQSLRLKAQRWSGSKKVQQTSAVSLFFFFSSSCGCFLPFLRSWFSSAAPADTMNISWTSWGSAQHSHTGWSQCRHGDVPP